MSRPNINPNLYTLDNGVVMQEGDFFSKTKGSQEVSLNSVKREFDSFCQPRC